MFLQGPGDGDQCTDEDWQDFYECMETQMYETDDCYEDMCCYLAKDLQCAPQCFCGEEEIAFVWNDYGCAGDVPLDCSSYNMEVLESYCAVDTSGQYCLLSNDTESLIMAGEEIQNAYENAWWETNGLYLSNATRPHLEVRL